MLQVGSMSEAMEQEGGAGGHGGEGPGSEGPGVEGPETERPSSPSSQPLHSALHSDGSQEDKIIVIAVDYSDKAEQAFNCQYTGLMSGLGFLYTYMSVDTSHTGVSIKASR